MSLIHDLKDFFWATVNPVGQLSSLLEQAEITAPDKALFDRGRTLPVYAILNLMSDALWQHPKKDFKDALIYQKASTVEDINLLDIFGCSASKSPCGDFNEMKVSLPQNKEEADKLAEQVFQGSYDCVAFKDKHAEVIRQGWDGIQWFSNSGGSHRTSSVYLFDKQHNIERPISSKVLTYSVNPDLEEFAKKNSIWIFKMDDMKHFISIKHLLHPSLDQNKTFDGIGFNALNVEDHYALTVPHSYQDYQNIKDKMHGTAFNASHWALNPDTYDFTAEQFLIPKR